MGGDLHCLRKGSLSDSRASASSVRRPASGLLQSKSCEGPVPRIQRQLSPFTRQYRDETYRARVREVWTRRGIRANRRPLAPTRKASRRRMLRQLLDLVRENAALRRELAQTRQTAEALRRLLTDGHQTRATCSCLDSSASGVSEDTDADARGLYQR